MTRAKLLFWLILALPAGLMTLGAMQPGADLEELLHPTGEFSARLLIVALAITPLVGLLPRVRALRWLLAHRRAIGVAAFGYAALHTLFYVMAMGSLDDVLAEIGANGIWTGWAAFALMLAVALTSNAVSVRALGAAWKSVQRLAYPVALLTLAHWVLVHNGWRGALVHFGLLGLLEATRFLPSRTRSFA